MIKITLSTLGVVAYLAAFVAIFKEQATEIAGAANGFGFALVLGVTTLSVLAFFAAIILHKGGDSREHDTHSAATAK